MPLSSKAEYFDFINMSQGNIKSDKPLVFNFGLPWMRNLNNFSHEDTQKIFRHVIAQNNWSSLDKIKAQGDMGHVAIYTNGSIEWTQRGTTEDV